ncbi:prephenate dehydrogenase/arogenate dehydrogenase family protein [Actinomadura rupiterrae]|uniref:prephenate dehydrogenase/arogenate dehydrogenase family protein n=1 Tax=Actinomadura rupiterrae TaxID=559627 RepID=UPI0020A257D5|nr:prephenate dehydrogenase/arogenate dehydrogenase family protein [Actinomadura rupiterrae]MCP2338095.1 prephenate dehydrogenase [Actinomadura rupiterrae]
MTARRVLVAGTGLLGASVGLALAGAGADVQLLDTDLGAVAKAEARGAGRGWDGAPVELAVLATPPHVVAECLAKLQQAGAASVYTDVASVKQAVLDEAEELGCDLSRFVGGHPMAGGETSGPGAARADLFTGRPWALCPAPDVPNDVMDAVLRAVAATGARPVFCTAAEHDAAVGLVSHAPHMVASALAATLVDAPPLALHLAGRGLADTTRIAAGDVTLWRHIVLRNRVQVAEGVRKAADRLARLADDLHLGDAEAVEALLADGAAGRALLD